MDLRSYLAQVKKECPGYIFMRRLGVSVTTFNAILNGNDIKLSLAYKIVKESGGKVTVDDLYMSIKKSRFKEKEKD